jgi:hypothetical protein
VTKTRVGIDRLSDDVIQMLLTESASNYISEDDTSFYENRKKEILLNFMNKKDLDSINQNLQFKKSNLKSENFDSSIGYDKIQIIVSNNKPSQFITDEFDLLCCQVKWNGYTLNTYSIEDIIAKRGYQLFPNASSKRLQKYRNRGYTILPISELHINWELYFDDIKTRESLKESIRFEH